MSLDKKIIGRKDIGLKDVDEVTLDEVMSDEKSVHAEDDFSMWKCLSHHQPNDEPSQKANAHQVNLSF